MKASEITFDLVTKIYFGKDSCCRCGCGGNYAEPGTPTFTKYKNAILKLRQEFLQEDKEWINISLPNNRAYTPYFS